ncbi:unnamed protein product [Blepharisma stoltei]|uniref:Uncharacterized protein n=1 Tax=Blepharisma stoltei TaxID=1481888 RepID=A0AAU9K8N1_9CILI|nr:unnamed protein product [Blepharisma stoltei]
MQNSLNMNQKQCSEPGCELEAEYGCQCTSPETYLCKLHWMKHCELPNRDHTFESVFLKPCEGTQEAILEFLKSKLSENQESRKNITVSFSQHLNSSEDSFENFLKRLDSESAEIKICFEKISEAKKLSKFEQDPLLKLLALQPNEAIEKIKPMLSCKPDSYTNINLICSLTGEIEKIIESFIKNKFEKYLENKLSGLEKTLEKHDQIINSANDFVENLKDTISTLIAENEKSKKDFEEWKQEVETKRKWEVASRNSQLSNSITDILKVSNLNKKQLNFKNWSPDVKINEIKSATLNEAFNSEIDQDSISVCSLYESEILSVPDLRFYYQDNFDTEIKKKSLYLIDKGINKNTNLIVFDTENEMEDIKTLNISDQLDSGTCIAQLPDGKFFCFGKRCPASGISLTIDKKLKICMMPSGTPCCYSSAVYFNRNIYCFGGWNDEKSPLALSERFDMNENKWIKLSPLPNPDCCLHSLIFKKNILISGSENRKLLRYSILGNDFTTIPFEFAERKRKIMVNAVRLYLIECGGFIYESEIEDDTVWKIIAPSVISEICPWQVYCLYNKETIYIGCRDLNEYYKFSLLSKNMAAILHTSQESCLTF